MPYTKTTDFAIKDTYLSGNPAKVIKGVEIDTEFNNIATNFNGVGPLLSAAAADTTTSPTDTTTGRVWRTDDLVKTTSATDTTAGRVLKVGDFGLPTVAGYLALPTLTATDSATDLNTITSQGWWHRLLGGSPGSRPANYPIGQAVGPNFVYLFVANYAANQTQLAISYSSGGVETPRTWMRYGVSGVWQAWVEVWTTGNLVPTDTTRIDVASAATINLTTSAPNTRHINITGTTGITAFTVAAGQCYFVRFNAALTLTNNANIVTQTGANITTAAGDTCILRATAANVVEVLSFVPALSPAIGAGQTWQDVTGSRALATTYTNSTGKPIEVSVTVTIATSQSATATVAGVAILTDTASAAEGRSFQFVVQNGATYQVTATGGSAMIKWAELR